MKARWRRLGLPAGGRERILTWIKNKKLVRILIKAGRRRLHC